MATGFTEYGITYWHTCTSIELAIMHIMETILLRGTG